MKKISQGKCHMFSVGDAVKYGMPKAAILHNIRFWLDKNSANDKEPGDYHRRKHSDGNTYVWTYNSGAAFHELMPYINQRTIERHLKQLVQDGILISGNFNKLKIDRTTWYTMPEYLVSRGKGLDRLGQRAEPLVQSEEASDKMEEHPTDCRNNRQADGAIPDSKQQMENGQVENDKENSLTLFLQARREEFSFLFLEEYKPLTPEEADHLTPEWLREAVEDVRDKFGGSGTPLETKVEELMKWFPLARVVNTIIYAPVTAPAEMRKLWTQWRGGTMNATLDDYQMLRYLKLYSRYPGEREPGTTLKDFLSAHSSEAMEFLEDRIRMLGIEQEGR